MIIPEITNSNLNKDIFMIEFKKLIENNLQNEIQINKVNESLKKFEVKNHPYKTAAKRILNYL